MVPVPVDHLYAPVNKQGCPFWHFREIFVIVTLGSCFANYIYSNFICQIEVLRRSWIMACPHQVDVELFHQFQIFAKGLQRHCLSFYRMVHVTVYPIQFHHPSVYPNSPLFDFGLPESDFGRNTFKDLSSGIFQSNG